jgi:oligoendopeptidase F
MILATLFALAVTVGATSAPTYRVDLTRYFASPAAEAAQRPTLMAELDRFIADSTHPLATPAALLALLRADDRLRREIRLHELYEHLRAAADTEDHAAAAADLALGFAEDRLDAARAHAIRQAGQPALDRFLAIEPALAPWRHLVESDVQLRAAAVANEHAVAVLAKPALESLAKAYGDLRRAALVAGHSASAPADAAAAFHAKWTPWQTNGPAFAALLVPIATIQDGQARLQGYTDAAEAAYASQGLTSPQVHAVLAAVRVSPAWANYTTLVASATARRLGVPPDRVTPWQMEGDGSWHAQPVALPEALERILAAEREVGPAYADQFERLLDPASARVDWCRGPSCDDVGFSVGAPGATSALFYGAYDGGIDSVRAVAHEAAHAVHRQLMSEHQPIAAYQSGPKFIFESFAIFNELLVLDHLQRSATTREDQRGLLRWFIDDAIRQVFGSARETALEEALHADVQAGRARTAADLDARTLAVFADYTPPQQRSEDSRAFWSRNRLYFIDPFYDTNYLFAGLLALAWLRQFEQDPRDFERRYVALLENGFDAPPQAILQRFMHIDLADGAGLVRDANATIVARTAALARLYEAPEVMPAP